MNNNTRAMLFEQLPLEIFLEIFASFSLFEIITAFSDLNFRIDSYIQAVTQATHTVSYNDISAIDLVQLFPTQIGRLMIKHSPVVDLSSLANLRSLTIKYGTLTQFDGIRPHHFPRLEILHLCAINSNSMNDKTKSLDDLFGVIFSNGFSRLRICTAVGFDLLRWNSAWTGSPTLRLLILDLRTSFDYEQIRSLCPNLRQYKSSSQRPVDLETTIYTGRKKLILKHIMRVKQFESEKKFLLDSWSTIDMIANPHTDTTILPFIRGRIFPEKDPYCCASFLIEIKFPLEYPFKSPEARILDPIYHPNVRENGKHCCYWGFNNETWNPAIQLIDFIKGVIRVIDNVDVDNHCNITCTTEYQNNYEQFYEKALRCILDYGRSRF